MQCVEKIPKEVVQEPPEARVPCVPPGATSSSGAEPPVRAQGQGGAELLYLLELLGGVFNPLVLFLHRFWELLEPSLAERERLGFSCLSLHFQP